MAYIGKIPGGTAISNRTLDSMTGDGSDTTLTLSQTPDSVMDVAVYYNGVMQRPGTDYTLSGNTVTFTTAPPNSVSVIALTGGSEDVGTPMVDSVTTDKLVDGVVTDAKISGTVSSSKLTGALPALNGNALTNMASALDTTSSNNPTISTNPATGVGTVWGNSSTGQIFVCTDATAGENVWTNIGAGSGDVEPWSMQGEIAGFASGGHNGSTAVQKYVFSSATTNATGHGNLNSRCNMRFLIGTSSETHGYTFSGGGGGGVNYADKFAFASNTTAASLGSNPLPHQYFDRGATAWTQTHGFLATGETTDHTDIVKVTYASDNIADDGRDVFLGRHGATGHSSATHAYLAGGAPSPRTNTIQRYAFSSSANGTDVGDMTVAKDSGAGSSSQTHGYSAGGADYPTGYTGIEKFAFAASGNSTNIGDLTTSSRHLAGSSSTTHGYRHGGVGNVDIIERWSHTTDADSVDVGNLVSGHDGMTGNHY